MGSLSPDEAAVIRELAVKLMGRAPNICFSCAESLKQRTAILRQRYSTVVSRRWASVRDYPDELESDEFDTRSVFIQGHWNGSLVTSARIVLPHDSQPLPLEASNGLTLAPQGEYVEIGRTIVTDSCGLGLHRVFAGLIGRCLEEVIQRDFSGIAAVANRAMLRIYERLGICVARVGERRRVWGESRMAFIIDVGRSAHGMLGAIEQRF